MTDIPALAAKAAETLDLVALTDNPDKQRQLIQQSWEQAKQALAALDADNEPDQDRKPQEETVTQASGHEAPNDTRMVYTPSIKVGRNAWIYYMSEHPYDSDEHKRRYAAEFDRMLETVRHNAWEEGHETGLSDEKRTVLANPLGVVYGVTPNPYKNYEPKETK